MMPIGPLMVEHRLIERMIAQLAREARRIRETGRVDTDFVLSAIDFIRIYADRCHHGKEEEILFRELRTKALSPEHRRVMEELEAEHVQGRKTAARVALVRERVLRGEATAAKDLAFLLEELVRFYPPHIEKEDRHFFLPCMEYFTEAEQARMLEEGQAFDRSLLHTFYEGLLEAREGASAGKGPGPAGPAGPSAGPPHRCTVCGYVYDSRTGDPSHRIPAGTSFDELPETWECPQCHVSRRMFVPA